MKKIEIILDFGLKFEEDLIVIAELFNFWYYLGPLPLEVVFISSISIFGLLLPPYVSKKELSYDFQILHGLLSNNQYDYGRR